MDVLRDRKTATVSALQGSHSEVEIVSRDRSGGYGQTVAAARPEVVHVADRWHLLENASRASLNAVLRSTSPIRRALSSVLVKPGFLISAERIQCRGHLRRKKTNPDVKALAMEGLPIKQIVKRIGCSRRTLRRIVRGERDDVVHVRENSLEAWLPRLEREWSHGGRNGAELRRRLREVSFGGSLRVVTEGATRHRRTEAATDARPCIRPSASRLAAMLTRGRDHLPHNEPVTVDLIERFIPALDRARGLLDRLWDMVRQHRAEDHGTWVEAAAAGPLASFARGLKADQPAMLAALVLPWSNEPAEGHVTRLKQLKRQIFGRTKLDLPRARLLGSPKVPDLHRD